MQKRTIQIRDLKAIEHGLDNNFAGVLSFYGGEESVAHIPLTFIYLDKNIYLFFNADDEVYASMPYDNTAIFTTVKSEKGKKISNSDFDAVYRFFSVTIKGIIKKVDEVKIIEDIRKRYLKKYSTEIEDTNDHEYLKKLVMIDTEEIQAIEEIGG